MVPMTPRSLRGGLARAVRTSRTAQWAVRASSDICSRRIVAQRADGWRAIGFQSIKPEQEGLTSFGGPFVGFYDSCDKVVPHHVAPGKVAKGDVFDAF